MTVDDASNPVSSAEKDYLVIRFNWYKALLIAIIFFTIVTRLYGLASKPYHHDESLYATYSWYIYTGRGHQYDPMLHGPFMFHLNALIFLLAGVSDFTARLSAALFGIALVCCTVLLRKQLGRVGVAAAATFFAVSPVYMYFSRFLRHDIYFALWAFFAVAFYVNYLSTRRRGFVYGWAAALALMFCVKENSYLTLLIFVAFYIFSKLFEKPKRVMLFLLCYLVAGLLIDLLLTGYIVKGLRGYGFKAGIPFAFAFIYSAAPAYYLYERFARKKGGVRREVAETGGAPSGRLRLLDTIIGTAIFFGIFYFLYTNMFAWAPGFLDGLYRKSLGYWVHQDDIQRIKGPFTYFCPIAITYELPLLVVVIAGLVSLLKKGRLSGVVLVGSSAIALPLMIFWHQRLPADPWDRLLHMTNSMHIVFALYVLTLGLTATCCYLKEGRRFPAFLSFWSWTSLLLYSYAGEKVPWLLMHVLMPLILWAAVILDEFIRSERFKRTSALYIVLMLIGLFLYLQASIRLCFFNEANPDERMVYTQTSEDVKKSLQLISRLADKTGKGLDLPIGVQGDSTWPYTWYLRDYKRWFHPGPFTSPEEAVIVVDWTKRSDYRHILEPNYVERRFKLREWWVPEPVSSLKNPITAWLKYYFRREPWSITGSQDIAFYIRRDLLGREAGVPVREEAEKAVPPRPTPNIPPRYGTVGTIQPVAVVGERGSAPGKLNEPRGIWVDGKGNVYVADTKNHRWQKFDRKGNCLLSVGKEGSGKAQFREPMGIAVDGEGSIYVADTWNHRIQKFDREGRYLTQWGGGAGGFWAPKGLAFDSEGYLYVVDTGKHRVQKFTRDGKFLRVWGSRGDLPGQFSEPVGIAIERDGVIRPADEEKGAIELRGDVIYVADTANRRVQKFDTRGAFLGQFGVLGWEEYYTEPFVALDREGRVWVTDSRNNRVEIFSPQGTLLGLWSAKGFMPGQFNVPIGIFIRDGRVYVSDTYNFRIQVFSEKRVMQ